MRRLANVSHMLMTFAYWEQTNSHVIVLILNVIDRFGDIYTNNNSIYIQRENIAMTYPTYELHHFHDEQPIQPSYRSHRLLMVFRQSIDDWETIQSKICLYQQEIAYHRATDIMAPEPFVLLVYPPMPSYALQTPDLLRIAEERRHEIQELLQEIGTLLDIDEAHQLLAEGYGNPQAWYAAKFLNIDTVLGYSKRFAGFIARLDTIQTRWPRLRNGKHISDKLRLRNAES